MQKLHKFYFSLNQTTHMRTHPDCLDCTFLQPALRQIHVNNKQHGWMLESAALIHRSVSLLELGTLPRFRNTKLHSNFFLTSSLSAQINSVISITLSLGLFQSDWSWGEAVEEEMEEEEEKKKEEVSFFFTQCFIQTYFINAGGMSLFITWSSVVWTVSFPTCNQHNRDHLFNYH